MGKMSQNYSAPITHPLNQTEALWRWEGPLCPFILLTLSLMGRRQTLLYR
jgi:hypothetical protein